MASNSAGMIRDAGLRVTRPRVLVFDLVTTQPHSDAETILRAARATLPGVSKQAVYDVLEALTTSGLLRRIRLAGHSARYETRVGDNHHHIVCRTCGVIVDADCATGEPPCMQPAHDHGFVLDEAEVTFWGVCPDCAPTQSIATRDRPQNTSIGKDRS
ncbi:Fur family transcriptional regulator [Rhodococcus sp. NPDC078407]|uniref:Fur family transcriptional regulator n=1 Tax=Rhodococcus sp. NPDC078407 TaxID=3364509 RepID=UPI0037C85A6E